MDIQTLSQQLSTFLAPFLPFLLNLGEKAAEEAAKKLGAEAWEQAKALWGKLKPKVEAKPAAQEAAQEVAAHPEDEDARAALRLQLRKLLAEDKTLAREVQQALETPAVRQVIARGARSVAIGGSVSGSVIVTGDRNTALTRKPSKGITMIPVESSMVDSVGYDEELHLLQVVFTSGRVYCYEDVPPEVFHGLLEAESKGQYMRAYIIDVYPYRRGPCRKR